MIERQVLGTSCDENTNRVTGIYYFFVIFLSLSTFVLAQESRTQPSRMLGPQSTPHFNTGTALEKILDLIMIHRPEFVLLCSPCIACLGGVAAEYHNRCFS